MWENIQRTLESLDQTSLGVVAFLSGLFLIVTAYYNSKNPNNSVPGIFVAVAGFVLAISLFFFFIN